MIASVEAAAVRSFFAAPRSTLRQAAPWLAGITVLAALTILNRLPWAGSPFGGSVAYGWPATALTGHAERQDGFLSGVRYVDVDESTTQWEWSWSAVALNGLVGLAAALSVALLCRAILVRSNPWNWPTRWQMSLRTLFLLLTVISVAVASYAYLQRRIGRMRRNAELFERLATNFRWGYSEFYVRPCVPLPWASAARKVNWLRLNPVTTFDPPFLALQLDANLGPWSRNLTVFDHVVGGSIRKPDGSSLDNELAEICQMPGIEVLFLDEASLTVSGLSNLRNAPDLTILSLPRGTTDEGLAQIADCTNLLELHLRACPITNTGLVHLKGLQRLEMLSLEKCDISDEGLAHLSRLKNLKTLSLNETKVTAVGIARLRQLIPRLQVNYEVSLAHN